jgi:hypothetical protein
MMDVTEVLKVCRRMARNKRSIKDEGRGQERMMVSPI